MDTNNISSFKPKTDAQSTQSSSQQDNDRNAASIKLPEENTVSGEQLSVNSARSLFEVEQAKTASETRQIQDSEEAKQVLADLVDLIRENPQQAVNSQATQNIGNQIAQLGDA